MPLGVRFIPLTNAIPDISYFLVLRVRDEFVFGAKSSLHDPYGKGYSRGASVTTIRSNTARWSESLTVSQFELHSEIRVHEEGILSNRV